MASISDLTTLLQAVWIVCMLALVSVTLAAAIRNHFRKPKWI